MEDERIWSLVQRFLNQQKRHEDLEAERKARNRW